MFTLRWRPFSQQTVINRDDWFLAVRDASVFWLSFGFYWSPVNLMINRKGGVDIPVMSEEQAQLKYADFDCNFCADIEGTFVVICVKWS